MCKAVGHPQMLLTDILKALRHDVATTEPDEDGLRSCKPGLAWEAANCCPACLLAAIRQIKKTDDLQFDWDFKAAKQRFWNGHNRDTAGVY
jgi:hypothetical protein